MIAMTQVQNVCGGCFIYGLLAFSDGRREEGNDNRFSPDVYRIIREVVFPFPKLERPQLQTITKDVCKDSFPSASTGSLTCSNSSQYTSIT